MLTKQLMSLLIIFLIFSLWMKKTLLTLVINLEVIMITISIWSLMLMLIKFHILIILTLTVAEAVLSLTLIMKISSVKKFITVKTVNLL